MTKHTNAGSKGERPPAADEATVPRADNATSKQDGVIDETTVQRVVPVDAESTFRPSKGGPRPPAVDPILAGATFKMPTGDTRPRSALLPTESELEPTGSKPVQEPKPRPDSPGPSISATPTKVPPGAAGAVGGLGSTASTAAATTFPPTGPRPLNAPSGDVGGPVTPETRPAPTRRTRKARLRLTRVDPWSVMKTAFLFAIAFGVMMWVSVYVVWSVIEASGLFDSVNKILNDTLGSPDGTSKFQLQDYVNTSRVLGYTALLSAVNIVITTALCTLFAFLYNLSATVLGGLEVTLAED